MPLSCRCFCVVSSCCCQLATLRSVRAVLCCTAFVPYVLNSIRTLCTPYMDVRSSLTGSGAVSFTVSRSTYACLASRLSKNSLLPTRVMTTSNEYTLRSSVISVVRIESVTKIWPSSSCASCLHKRYGETTCDASLKGV